MLSNPIGTYLVLLGLVVMPVGVLVLPFNFDNHLINPINQIQDPRRDRPSRPIVGYC